MKTTFFAEIFKNEGPPSPLLTPMLVSPVKTWSTSSQSKQHAAVRSCSVLAYGELEILLNQFIDHK